MADPLITKLEVKRALGCLTTHKGTGPGGLFPMVLKALSYRIILVLARMFNVSLATRKAVECIFT